MAAIDEPLGDPRERARFIADEAPLIEKRKPILDRWAAWIEQHAGWLVLLGLLLAGASIPIVLSNDWPNAWPFWVASSFLLLPSVVLFTRPLDDPAKIYSIFRFAWGFLSTAVIASGMLLYTSMLPPSDPEDEEQNKELAYREARDIAAVSGEADGAALAPEVAENQKALERSLGRADQMEDAKRKFDKRRFTLISIVYGCDFHATKSGPDRRRTSSTASEGSTQNRSDLELPFNPGMPPGIHCGELAPQWVISIGGNILTCHLDGRCPRTLPPIADATKLNIRLKAAQEALAKARASLAGMDVRIRETANARQRGLRISGLGVDELIDVQTAAQEQVATQTALISDLESQLAQLKNWSDLNWNMRGAPIVGGIVVPIYFVVMTIIGAVIGLFRKLPEFQDRVEATYPAEYQKRLAEGDSPLPPISRERARELVVFQILQVICAPAIGILAYSYARPEQIASTVILAFGAGFSSELILVAVRATVDRLIGLGPRPARAREIAAAEAAKRDELPAPGPIRPAPPGQSGGFKVGDRVTLVQRIGVLNPGSQGIVMSIGDGGVLIVRSTQDQGGVPIDIVLDAKPPEFFRHSSQDATAPDGPVG